MLLVKYIFPDTWALKFALLGRARTPIDHIKSMSSHATCRPFDDWLWFQWDFCKLLCFRVGSGGFYIFWALLLLLNSSLLEGMQIGVCDRSKILTRTRYYCTWSGRKSNEFYFCSKSHSIYESTNIIKKKNLKFISCKIKFDIKHKWGNKFAIDSICDPSKVTELYKQCRTERLAGSVSFWLI